MKKAFILAGILSATAMFSCSQEANQTDEQEVVETELDETQPQEAVQDTIKGSIKSEATGKIGEANIRVNYHAPGVKGRVIWGGLVPYGQVWVTGAHMATNLETDKDLLIGGKELKAGKYALFTIPGKEEWTVIINKNWEQHLADNYKEAEDVLRIQAKPEKLDKPQERLMYELVEQEAGKGALRILWDRVGITVPIEVKK